MSGRWVMAGVAWVLLINSGQADDDWREARRLMRSETILPMEQVLQVVQEQKPGRILEVELERKHGGYIYEFELLDAQGVVWEIEVDALTGRIVELEQED